MENETKDLLPGMTQPRLVEWFERIAVFVHGTSKAMTSETLGQRLQVTPDDMGRAPIEGIFIPADAYEIVLRLSNEKL